MINMGRAAEIPRPFLKSEEAKAYQCHKGQNVKDNRRGRGR